MMLDQIAIGTLPPRERGRESAIAPINWDVTELRREKAKVWSISQARYANRQPVTKTRPWP